jgi:hypothetical protein
MELRLVGRVSTDDPTSLRPALNAILQRHPGTCRDLPNGEFDLELAWDSPSAWDANRELLTELRWSVKNTQIRAQWTHGATIERFSDYTPEGK